MFVQVLGIHKRNGPAVLYILLVQFNPMSDYLLKFLCSSIIIFHSLLEHELYGIIICYYDLHILQPSTPEEGILGERQHGNEYRNVCLSQLEH